MATVVFLRDTTSNIENIPIVDGQIILSTDENFIYLDNGNQRIQYRNNGLASGVQYDNSQSLLQATNVQSAIDEVADRTNIATVVNAGIVKPDGTTIKINASGVIRAESTGANVSYNNTTTHMVATDVQGAIDELYGMITDLANNLSTNYSTSNQMRQLLDDKFDKRDIQLDGNTLNFTLDEITPA